MTDVLDRIHRLTEPQRRLLRLRLSRMGGDPAGDSRLVGYVVPETAESLSGQNLRRFLSQRLPEYMVPATWVFLDAFPLTTRGKVDRKALSDMVRPAPESFGQGAPGNDLEQAIAHIWEEVLGLRTVGFHDNFFDLGGHSLLLPKVLTKVRGIASRDVSMVDLFRYPTVRALAAYIAADQPSSGDDQTVQQMKDKREAGVRRMKQRRAQQNVLRGT